MARFRALLVLVLVSFSGSICAAPQPLQHLEHLVGSWKLSDATTEDAKAFRLAFHFTSRETALVEIYGNPAGNTTETLYHADGESLMATHYCARGNQPRLRAIDFSRQDQVTFHFVDVTNLPDKNLPHMIRMTYTFIDNDHFKREEVYLVNGKEQSSTMSLVREHKS